MRCLSSKRATGLRPFFLALNLFCAPLCLIAADNAASGAAPPEQIPTRPNSRARTPAVQDILKMLDAGVSKEIIKTYVENSSPSNPTAEDLIALKQHSVPDEITTALLKRMADAKPAPMPARATTENPPATQAVPATQPIYQKPARLDPESYEFWWYHYAYPRTLAYSYERLYPYSPIAPYQFYRPIPFGPRYGYPGPIFP